MKDAITIGSLVVEPGTIGRGSIRLTDSHSGPETSPLNVVNGSKPGPVLWIQACVHGGEYGGQLGILRALGKLNPKEVSGAIIAVMAASPLAFSTLKRESPIDGENQNRCFPGNPEGPHSQQLAAEIMAQVLAHADAVLDLHSGGVEALVPFYSLYWSDDSAASQASREMACAVGGGYVWECGETFLAGTLIANVTKHGLPATIIECGGGRGIPDQDIEDFSKGILGVCAHLGIVSEHSTEGTSQTFLRDSDWIYTARGGLFMAEAKAGDVVEAGQVLGRVANLHGEIVEVVHAKRGKAYLGAMIPNGSPVATGSLVSECLLLV